MSGEMFSGQQSSAFAFWGDTTSLFSNSSSVENLT
jgi:hypothetical protein